VSIQQAFEDGSDELRRMIALGRLLTFNTNAYTQHAEWMTKCNDMTCLFEERIKCQSSIMQNITIVVSTPETQITEQLL